MDGIQKAPAQVCLPVPRVARPVVGRRYPHILQLELQHHVNGDLDEDEALQLALQENIYIHYLSASGVIVEISDDKQYSPVFTVALLLERMNIVPNQRPESDYRSKSRSVILDFSPSPSPGLGSRPGCLTGAGPQKRNLDLMHGGDTDEVIKEASLPKRERVLEAGDYAGPQSAHDAADEVVFVGQFKRQNGVRKSGSMPGEQDPHRTTVAGETALESDSAIDWSSILSRARMTENFGNKM